MIVALDDRKKIIARHKWTRKFNLQQARNIFNKNKTLFPNVERKRLATVIETLDYRRGIRPKGNYSYVVKITFKNKETVYGISRHESDIPHSTKKEEAWRNAKLLLAQKLNQVYDEDVGEQIIATNIDNLQIEEGIRRYDDI